MTIATAIALVMFAVAPAQAIETVDVAFEELAAGENQAAIREINENEALDGDDPARLLNLGVAHAREGDVETAREMFRAAVFSDDRQMLETADGEWVDSRALARQALAKLDSGEFSSTRMAANR